MNESEQKAHWHSADGKPETGPEGVTPAGGIQDIHHGTDEDTTEPVSAADQAITGETAQDPQNTEDPTGETAQDPQNTEDPTTVRSERDAYLKDLQRVTAEFANFRRRTTKRNSEIVAQAASGLAESLLPVLDACEAAASQGVEGVAVVHSQLLRVLKGAGLSVVGETGEAFDPNLHEAVAFELSDNSETDTPPTEGPVVANVMRTGYSWKDKVLRPAIVQVKG